MYRTLKRGLDMKFIIGITVLLLLVACSAQEAFAAKVGMRCNGALINVGDDILKVFMECGKPLVHMEGYDIYGNIYIRLSYKKYGMTYKITSKNNTLINISRSR